MADSPDSTTDKARRRRSPPRRVVVARVQTLSPAMRRITLAGDELAGFALSAPASYVKLIFPEAGQSEPVPPSPDGPRSMNMRTYTPRRFDAQSLELDVDFVLHGVGPASNWAEQAQPGQPLLLMGPGPGYAIDPDATEHLLIGDDSALPAVETILESLPPHARASVLAEVVGAREERPLASAVPFELRWAHRGEDPRDAGRALEAALRAMPTPAPHTRIYVACEAMAMRRIRRLLIDERDVPRSHAVGRGYWKLDEDNHSDQDYGEDA
jgi:NADPH-dependent ferric siderophore reductase